ncbi:YolD-like family protein [Halobacillus salinarum]|uniref:YolD-like family protein n=1 Tax=Halobacillus salinarum TaxID=2932257 RepID=A0ABY4EN80_9BACI|nr:YolD-like family protein [Halobacillus salinarum]UOQ45303.1 YolD-like family protein [Halobacillus salinarum]
MDSSNRDRGSIKWTSLMLPEHVEMIKKLWKEDERVEKGIMDEQKAIEIDFILQRALHDDLTVRVKVYNGFDYDEIEMKMEYINKMDRKIFGVDWLTKEKVAFQLEEISDISIV